MTEEKENLDIAEEEKSEKLVKLPLSRIKSIIKMDPDVNLASQEAVFLITKSTVRKIICHCAMFLCFISLIHCVIPFESL